MTDNNNATTDIAADERAQEMLEENQRLRQELEHLRHQLGECLARRECPESQKPDPGVLGMPFSIRKRSAVIIDDSKLIHIRYKSIIETRGVLVVATASDGTFGADLVLTHQPRLVVLDYNMPGTNGTECARMIRQADNQVKIIVVSGFLDADRIALLKSAGVDEILVKPINEQKFSDALVRLEV